MNKEIDTEQGLRVEINTENQTAIVIKSPGVSGNVFIPRLVEWEGKKYTIISIGNKAFENAKFDSLAFPEDSEVESFGDSIFYQISIKKIQIPPKLKKIDSRCFYASEDLVDIEVSPKNKNFAYIENKYLVGKCEEDSEEFDILYYSRFDIKEAVIPPQIKILNDYAFGHHRNLTSVIFPNNSKLTRIEKSPFFQSTVTKLVLPESLEYIHDSAFNISKKLFKIEISPKNRHFSVIDETFLVKKSESSKDFDVLIFCRRDAKSVKVPSYIKMINNCAFNNCNYLKAITFDSESSLETINCYALENADFIESIVFPQSVKYLIGNGIKCNHILESVVFLSQYLKITGSCFHCCKDKMILSFPNATKLEFEKDSMKLLPKKSILRIRQGCELKGDEFSKIKHLIEFIEPEKLTSESNKKDIKNSNKNKDKPKKKDESKKNKSPRNKNKKDEEFYLQKCMKRIRYLEKRLCKYEEVKPFDINSTKEEEDNDYEAFDDEIKIDTREKEQNSLTFIDEEDEAHQQILQQIGEGATSITYKVIDERTEEEMCKKVLKVEEKKGAFEDMRNIVKEFEILQQLTHPCICKCISINIQEKVDQTLSTKTKQDQENKNKNDDDDDECEIKIKRKKKSTSTDSSKTTVALFLKYHPMNLKECLEQDMLNNTLKSKLALEIAFGMSHIHKHGMIHRDLKLENVMVNYIFEAQLIDFGLAYVTEMKTTMKSKTKGIGTFAYMSPEMFNEEDYDKSTDVYSYGVLLLVLLTNRFPKQTMKEKLNNIAPQFPQPSSAISPFGIKLVKKCMSFDPKNRPTFDEIIEEMFENSFKLSSEVDRELVMRRYRSLNRFRSHEQLK